MITFEGVDGCGKSTQVALLAEALRREGREVLTLREPGGTVAAERIRELLIDPDTPLEPLAELLLFAAARADLVGKEIRPALERGVVVICDRFTDSTLAYQGVARGLGGDVVSRVNEVAAGGVKPDRTFYLRLDPAEAHARAVAAAGGGDRFEDEGTSFQASVARAYDELAEAEPGRIEVIDATGTVEKVHERVLAGLGAHGAKPSEEAGTE